jgi:hypothetical protein
MMMNSVHDKISEIQFEKHIPLQFKEKEEIDIQKEKIPLENKDRGKEVLRTEEPMTKNVRLDPNQRREIYKSMKKNSFVLENVEKEVELAQIDFDSKKHPIEMEDLHGIKEVLWAFIRSASFREFVKGWFDFFYYLGFGVDAKVRIFFFNLKIST